MSLITVLFLFLQVIYNCAIFILVFEEMMLLLVSFIFIVFLFMAEIHPRTFFVIITLLMLALCLLAFGFSMKSPMKFSRLDFVLECLDNLKIGQSAWHLTSYQNIMIIKVCLFLINRLIIKLILCLPYSNSIHFYKCLYQNAFLPIILENLNFLLKCLGIFLYYSKFILFIY